MTLRDYLRGWRDLLTKYCRNLSAQKRFDKPAYQQITLSEGFVSRRTIHCNPWSEILMHEPMDRSNLCTQSLPKKRRLSGIQSPRADNLVLCSAYLGCIRITETPYIRHGISTKFSRLPRTRIPKISLYIQLSVLGFLFGRFLAKTTYQNKEGSRGFIDAVGISRGVCNSHHRYGKQERRVNIPTPIEFPPFFMTAVRPAKHNAKHN